MRKQLFLDIDGCLADWLKATFYLHGLPSPNYAKGDWPYTRGPKGWYFYRELNMTSNDLFTGQASREFWRNFDWTPDGADLLALCERFFGTDICLLTSPYDGDGVVDGRKDWIKHNMPGYMERTLIGKCKDAIPVGNPNAILIDDWEENIISWRAAGGTGILLPRPYNSNEDQIEAVGALNWVERRLADIFEGTETL